MAQFPRADSRRGGRVVDGSGLENRQGASPRGFESHPLRQVQSRIAIRSGGVEGLIAGDSVLLQKSMRFLDSVLLLQNSAQNDKANTGGRERPASPSMSS